MRRFCLPVVPLLLLALLLATAPAHAQSRDSALVSLLRGTELGIGALLQTDLDAGSAVVNNGFTLRVARLRLKGAVRPVRFFVQTDFSDTRSILDMRVRLPIAEGTSVAAGLYKAPFSRELLTFRGAILMAERARAVNDLAPARQLGANLSTDLGAGVTLDVGVYNGTGGVARNDNDHFLYVGRLAGSVPLENGVLEYGANAGISEDDAVDLGRAARAFDGTRLLLGVDAELRTGRWLLSGELVSARLDADPGTVRWPTGGHLTGGVVLNEQHEIRLRLDSYDPDRDGSSFEDLWTVGYAFLASSSVEGVVNYTLPANDLDEGRLKLRLQVAIN